MADDKMRAGIVKLMAKSKQIGVSTLLAPFVAAAALMGSHRCVGQCLPLMTPEKFKETRRKLGLTQSELGALLDTASQTIRKLEIADDKLIGKYFISIV